jgi:hypothetical protein
MVWQEASRHGFFLVGRFDPTDHDSLARAKEASRWPACLGWLTETQPGNPDEETASLDLAGLTFAWSSLQREKIVVGSHVVGEIVA